MPYSDEFFEAMRYNPILAHQYLWRVAMGMKRSSLIDPTLIQERGETYQPPGFADVFAEDRKQRDWATVEARVADLILANIEVLVRTGIERPPCCSSCSVRNR